MALELVTIPCLKDNFAFLLHDAGSGQTALIDAPEAAPILAALKARGVQPTLAIVLVIVILPLSVIAGTLVNDIASVTQRIRTGDLNFLTYFQQIVAALPDWLMRILDRFGLGNFEALMAKLTEGAAQGSQMIAQQALSIGQNTFDFIIGFFVMLYLLFFLLRDGAALSRKVRESFPLARSHTHYLLNKFTTVIRATVKGNVVVAAVQGTLGGVAFALLGVQGALLWGVVMAFLSLLPAVGAALIVSGVPVIFSLTAMAGAFACAVATGLVFGYMPARRAAGLDPVVALASE